MPKYAAVLGHQPHVSLAELTATIAGFRLEKIVAKQIALFDAAEDIQPALLETLGGCMILAQQITKAAVTMEDIPQILHKETEGVRKKVTYGIRSVGIPSSMLKKAYRQCKEYLRSKERPSRYIGNEKKPAATVLVRDSGLLDGKLGCELFVVGMRRGDEEEDLDLWVGKTIAVQDVDGYTWRDMEKPVRDTTVGLLPPKLAQILLNLGGWLLTPPEVPSDGKKKRRKKVSYTVFDPFCGTGVIPMECLLREWHVLGSDISQKAIKGCQKNIDWLRKERKILKKAVESTIWKQDAQKAFTLKKLPDVIVTETTLGPALTKRPSQRDAKKMLSDNEAVQAAFLKNASATLPGVPLVCTWPFWRLRNDIVRLEKVWNVIEECGYQPVLPVAPKSPERPSLLYQRKDQFVGREIVILQPKKR